MRTSLHMVTESTATLSAVCVWSARWWWAIGQTRGTGQARILDAPAVGVVESSHIRIMRVADNMRNVAVTEGDKVEAQIKFGWEVDAYPVNEIAESVDAVSKSDVNALVDEYYEKYNILLEGRDPGEFRKHVAVQAQIELGFERFLEEKNYQAIVTHFGDLGALKQLPGLAIQRLMEKATASVRKATGK